MVCFGDEARDQCPEGLSPKSLPVPGWIDAAQLERGESFAEGMELERGFVHRAVPERLRLCESRDSFFE